MTAFDPNAFLNTEVNGENATTFVPVPEGEWPAVAKKIDARTLSNGTPILDVTWGITSPEVSEVTGMEEPSVRQSIFLDVDENTGALSMGKGKNVQLGRLREALDMNDPSKPFAPSMIEGRTAKVLVKHRIVEQDTYADVKGVTKL